MPHYIRLGEQNPEVSALLRYRNYEGARIPGTEQGDDIELYIQINGVTKNLPVTIQDVERGLVRCTIPNDLFNESGTYQCYFKNKSKNLSFPNRGFETIIVSPKFTDPE